MRLPSGDGRCRYRHDLKMHINGWKSGSTSILTPRWIEKRAGR
ncbi:hypothetical protein ACLK19_03900 [Escherichia coli]